MEIKEAIYNRRSVRKYLARPVEREKLDEVLRAGSYAPSAMNNMKRQFVAITKPELLNELRTAVEHSVDAETAARIRGRNAEGEFDFFYSAPVLIAVCTDPNELRPNEDCAIALENMFLAAYGEGLGTCWINQLTDKSDLPEIHAVLKAAGMKDGYKVYGCCALGYADGETKLSKPKTNEIVIS